MSWAHEHCAEAILKIVGDDHSYREDSDWGPAGCACGEDFSDRFGVTTQQQWQLHVRPLVEAEIDKRCDLDPPAPGSGSMFASTDWARWTEPGEKGVTQGFYLETEAPSDERIEAVRERGRTLGAAILAWLARGEEMKQ